MFFQDGTKKENKRRIEKRTEEGKGRDKEEQAEIKYEKEPENCSEDGELC